MTSGPVAVTAVYAPPLPVQSLPPWLRARPEPEGVISPPNVTLRLDLLVADIASSRADMTAKFTISILLQ